MAASTPTKTLYYLYKFNEYSNRIVKKYTTINDYLTASATYDTQTAANFCELDGVLRPEYTYRRTSTLIGTPNYAILTEGNDIISRWYITDAVNINKNTFKLTLKRDSVADYLDDILSAPTYIEKGTLSINDPFIYNSEAMQFNQIKTSETLLKDRTSCPWIVGFMAQKQPDGTTDPITTQIATNMMGQPDVTYNSMANYPYWAYMGNPYEGNTNYYKAASNSGSAYTCLTIYINAYDSTGITGRTSTEFYTYYYTPNNGWSYETGKGQNSSPTQFTTAYRCNYDVQATLFRKIYRAIAADPNITELARNYATLYGSDIHTEAQGNTFESEAGKIVKTNGSATQPTTGTAYPAGLYSLSVPYSAYGSIYGTLSHLENDFGDWDYASTLVNTSSQLHQAILNILAANASTWGLEYMGNYTTAGIVQEGKLYLVDATSTSASQITFSFGGTEKGLGDAPYRMFALPYNDNTVKWKFGSSDANVIVSNKNINMSVAQGISKTFSGTWLYDLQLVPFCPFVKSDRVSVNNNNEVIIDIQNLTQNIDYTSINYNGSQMSYIIWCEYSQINDYHINYNIPVATTAIDKKINNQCNVYRLSSPTYNSIFEFNAEKNGGVTYFDVDLVYKPYDSYIHINPNFGMLYGQDFNDARGLVFTGPFSLPQTTSAWMQYKLNNMNYQNSFDRQIENMEVMHDYDIKEQGIKSAMNAVSSTVGGVIAGLKTGGVAGAVAGGTIGAAVSTANYAVNYQLSQARYGETIDYTQDQFNYSLQNIKAQAQALSKVSSFTPNNKVFPILEYYTCTGTEKEAFREKLRYNGMTVGKIDTIQNFYSFVFPSEDSDKRYTKGKVIRLNISEDSHIVEDIKEEINKGVFI